MDYFPVRIVLWKFRRSIASSTFSHVTIMAFHKFKKELTNNQINGLYCSATLSDIGMQLLYHCSPPVDKKTVRIYSLIQIKRNGWQSIKRRHSNL
jgi:hypothetical protein